MTAANAHITDDQLRDALNDIDNDDDINVSSWEANFIDSLLYKNREKYWKLTPKQRGICFRMVDNYLGGLDYFDAS